MTPLMRYRHGIDPNQASFELKTEQLSVAILERNKDELERLKDDIGEVMDYLPLNIEAVKRQGNVDQPSQQTLLLEERDLRRCAGTAEGTNPSDEVQAN